MQENMIAETDYVDQRVECPNCHKFVIFYSVLHESDDCNHCHKSTTITELNELPDYLSLCQFCNKYRTTDQMFTYFQCKQCFDVKRPAPNNIYEVDGIYWLYGYDN